MRRQLELAELSQNQNRILAELLDKHATGDYRAECMFSLPRFGELLVLHAAKPGASNTAIQSVGITDLRALSDHGYVHLEIIGDGQWAVQLTSKARQLLELSPDVEYLSVGRHRLDRNEIQCVKLLADLFRRGDYYVRAKRLTEELGLGDNEYQTLMRRMNGLGVFESVESTREGYARSVHISPTVLDFERELEEATRATAEAKEAPVSTGTNVFVVHGHNENLKNQVARLVEHLQLHPIILHEQPDQGMTVIEKFEHHSSEAGFAVVLLTADDEGRKRQTDDRLRPRARQNVILELGCFLGRLTRKRVCIIYEEGVELPSDYEGVLYKGLDSSGKWKYELTRELKEAGFDVSLDDVT